MQPHSHHLEQSNNEDLQRYPKLYDQMLLEALVPWIKVAAAVNNCIFVALYKCSTGMTSSNLRMNICSVVISIWQKVKYVLLGTWLISHGAAVRNWVASTLTSGCQDQLLLKQSWVKGARVEWLDRTHSEQEGWATTTSKTFLSFRTFQYC